MALQESQRTELSPHCFIEKKEGNVPFTGNGFQFVSHFPRGEKGRRTLILKRWQPPLPSYLFPHLSVKILRRLWEKLCTQNVTSLSCVEAKSESNSLYGRINVSVTGGE
ncbi:hypothetical protein CEXT_475521 [Caerostris extrusa]|uniref:Uncharacterized protein n=1 Tax=Caerostris extrusa TaxID=172846 RepID=A0AAV4XBM1_CAEEX|nr:hypothetical protein CEXT_475521 [Caerostris extrusa]